MKPAKNYGLIKSVLDDALQFYVKKGANSPRVARESRMASISHAPHKVPSRPPGSVKEAFYALHHLKGIMRDSRIRALPANPRQWAEKFAAIDDADLMEDFWCIQSQIAQVLHKDVNSTGEGMYYGIALTNRETEERLDRQRDTRTFMTREGVRPFPARTTS
jgi:hypothetical protein